MLSRKTLGASVATVLLSAALLVPLSPHAQADAETPPPVPNAGFEVSSPAQGAPANWSIVYQGEVGSYEVVDTDAHSGAQAMRILDRSTSEQRGLLSSAVPVSPGQAYEVGAWVKVAQGTPAVVVYWYNAIGGRIGTANQLVRTGPSDWKWNSLIATAPAGAASARVMLYSATAYLTDALWDDVAIRPSVPVTEQALGVAVTAPNILDSAQGIAADGSREIYTVTTTTPALFQVLDAETGQEKHRASLTTGAMGAWSILTASDGRVYIGVYNNGHLYRWDPETATMSDLGRATPNARYVWDLEEAPDGRIWGGSYPLGEVFVFDPTLDVVTWWGTVTDEEYVRSVAVSDEGLVYAGSGSVSPHISVIDPATQAVTDLELPEKYRTEEFVYNLEARRDLLFMRLSPSSVMLVYDMTTGEWVGDLGAVSFGDVSPTGPGGLVYYIDAGGRLTSYDLARRVVAPTEFTGLQAARGFGWIERRGSNVPGRSLTFMYLTGEINHINLHARHGGHTVIESEAAHAPVRIQSVHAGPDGKVYVGGYMYDGVSVYDPETGSIDMMPRGDVGQIEGMWSDGDDLYIGSYTRANLFRFDTTRPWAMPGNPIHLGSLHDEGQDRPFAWTSTDDFVVTGTVPGYGQLGGALATIDRENNEVATHRNVIADHSVVALTTIDDVVYGGTSVWGGIGAVPTAQVGKVFAWDPATKEVLWEREPAPEAKAIQSIKAGPDGRLWAVDAGRLFELDPATGDALGVTPLVAFNWNSVGSVWVGADIEFDADGMMYVFTRGLLFRGDPDTLELVQIAQGGTAYGITVLDGDVYMAKVDQLVRVSTG